MRFRKLFKSYLELKGVTIVKGLKVEISRIIFVFQINFISQTGLYWIIIKYRDRQIT